MFYQRFNQKATQWTERHDRLMPSLRTSAQFGPNKKVHTIRSSS